MCQARPIDRAQEPSDSHTGRGDHERWLTLEVEQTRRTASPSGMRVTILTVRRCPAPIVRGPSPARVRGRTARARGLHLVAAERRATTGPPPDALSPLPVAARPHLSVVPRKECPPLIEPLTRREAEVLEQLAFVRGNAAIAAHLQISVRTVESHLSAIYGKLGVQGRLEALRYTLQTGTTGEPQHAREEACGT